MDYFSAVQEGRARVKKAVELLQEFAGPSYPVLFLKSGRQDWAPVGAEDLYSVVPGKDGTAAVVVCDSEGQTKAMSAWFNAEKAASIARELETRGLPKYAGDVTLPI